MNIDWFKDLAALQRTGNFSQAAEINNLSQSAFSRRISSLEAWVGATLVERGRYPVKLSDAGRQMLEAGEQALNRIETERAQIRAALEQPDKYVVTFGTQHSIGWRFFPAWLQAFETAFGPILSRLRADNLPNCIADLLAGEVDFVIAYASENANAVDEQASCESLVIGRDTLIPVCKPGTSGAPLFGADTDSTVPMPYLRFGPSAPIGQHLQPILDTHRLVERLNCIYENPMAGALRIRAQDGAGIAWLPKSLVTPDLEAGLLVQTGHRSWCVELEVRLHRCAQRQSQMVGQIWSFLRRNSAPLI
ncbi:MAG: LysR family transcriptional regulator [Gammaproteobacteria bacterium]|nr:LysR family transcriptional regulator [Gammaproteobacteria bacterium]